MGVVKGDTRSLDYRVFRGIVWGLLRGILGA